MKKTFLMSAMICIILIACSGQKAIPTAFPSIMPKPSFTATGTITLTTTKTEPTKLSPTQTITPLPAYQTKQIIFDYNVIGDFSVYDMFFNPDIIHPWSKLILYADGQMVIPGETYKQKILSSNEIKQFFSKLEALGFYSLESNQKHDPTDKPYNYGNGYQKSFDGREYCIVVNTQKSRNLCVYEPNIQFLIPKMKKILNFLDEYEPANMTSYYPDRILIWVQIGRNQYDDKLPKTTIPWVNHLPSLETSNQKITYVDGDMAKEIYLLFDSTNSGKVFTQNGIEYTVYFEVVLPNEELTNAYQ